MRDRFAQNDKVGLFLLFGGRFFGRRLMGGRLLGRLRRLGFSRRFRFGLGLGGRRRWSGNGHRRSFSLLAFGSGLGSLGSRSGGFGGGFGGASTARRRRRRRRRWREGLEELQGL